MSRKNYTKYSKMNKEEIKEVVLDKTSIDIPEINEYSFNSNERIDIPVAEIIDNNIIEVETPDEDIEEALKEETRTGIVSGCDRLRVRKEADIEADIYGTIEEGTELTVSITYSTEKFYKVNTIINGTLVSGYCMKKFINLK